MNNRVYISKNLTEVEEKVLHERFQILSVDRDFYHCFAEIGIYPITDEAECLDDYKYYLAYYLTDLELNLLRELRRRYGIEFDQHWNTCIYEVGFTTEETKAKLDKMR